MYPVGLQSPLKRSTFLWCVILWMQNSINPSNFCSSLNSRPFNATIFFIRSVVSLWMQHFHHAQPQNVLPVDCYAWTAHTYRSLVADQAYTSRQAAQLLLLKWRNGPVTLNFSNPILNTIGSSRSTESGKYIYTDCLAKPCVLYHALLGTLNVRRRVRETEMPIV